MKFVKNDIQNVSEFGSIERELYRDIEIIDFLDYPDSPYFDYSGYDIDRFKLKSDGVNEATREEREKVLKKYLNVAKLNYSLSSNIEDQIAVCIHEAIRNAQKHGNKLDSSKKIGVGIKLNSNDYLEMFVEDSGGQIKSDFFPYRQVILKSKYENLPYPSFYNFLETDSPKGHSGIGTRIIHEFSDSVSYHKSELGGLLVRMGFKF